MELMAALDLLKTTRDSNGRVLYSLNNSPAAQVRMERFLAREHFNCNCLLFGQLP